MTAPTSHEPSERRARFRFALGISLCAIYITFIFLQQRQPLFAGEGDFSSFYAAGHMVATGEAAQVYDRAQQWRVQHQLFPSVTMRQGPLIYNHAPFELLLFGMLGFLSYPHAVVAWYAFNACLLLLLPILLARRFPVLGKNSIFIYIVLAFFLPANVALLQGQDSILLLILFTLVFLNLRAGRYGLAGCLLACAAFKPQLVLPVMVIMAVWRKWKVLAAFAGTGIVLGLLSTAVVGWRTVLGFPAVLLAFNRLPAGVAAAYPEVMPNLRGLVYGMGNSYLPHPALQLITLALSALVMLTVAIAVYRDRGRFSALGFSLLMVADLLVSYHLNGHDLAILLLPVFLIAAHVAENALSPVRLMMGMTAGLLLFLPSLLVPTSFLAAMVLFFFILLAMESIPPNARAREGVWPLNQRSELRRAEAQS